MGGLFLHVKGYFASKRRDWRTSDTGELVFKEVRVPLGNLLGEENRGFYQIMDGFQTESLAMAKVLACEMAVRVTDICIQIHGGYGYMMEYEVERIWRDLRIMLIGGGTSEIQKEIIGNLLSP